MILDSEVRVNAISASLGMCYEIAVQESRIVLQEFYQLSGEVINDRRARFRLPPWMREKTKEGQIVFDPGSRIKSAILLDAKGDLWRAQWNISIEPDPSKARVLTGIEYLVTAERQMKIIVNYKPPRDNNLTKP